MRESAAKQKLRRLRGLNKNLALGTTLNHGLKLCSEIQSCTTKRGSEKLPVCNFPMPNRSCSLIR